MIVNAHSYANQQASEGLRCLGGRSRSDVAVVRRMSWDCEMQPKLRSSRLALITIIMASSGMMPMLAQRPSDASATDRRRPSVIENAAVDSMPEAAVIQTSPIMILGQTVEGSKSTFDRRNPFPGAKRTSDGRIIVVDIYVLKLFDSHGSFVRIIGGRGSGPTDLAQLRDVCIAHGDTIVAISYTRRRVAVFDTLGNRRSRTAGDRGRCAIVGL